MCVGCNFYGEKDEGKLGCTAQTAEEKEAGCEAMAQKTPGGCGCGSKYGSNKCSK
ncbi:MAG: hypothetical protein SCK28_13685 [Bacillota bacterium]|nr:hypothetical protein [Bacillota bacterium]